MSDVVDEDDTDALAAEFVLGTLDADERTHANLLVDIDDDFRRKVRVWERRLGELHLMVEPVDPAPPIWERIKGKVEETAPRPTATPDQSPTPPQQGADPDQPSPAEIGVVAVQEQTEPAPESASEPVSLSEPKPTQTAKDLEEKGPAVAMTLDEIEAELRRISLADHGPSDAKEREAGPAVADGMSSMPAVDLDEARERRTDVVARDRMAGYERINVYPADAAMPDRLRPALRRWRAIALLLTALIIVLGGLVAAWRYAPERLPPQLSIHSVLNVPLPPPPPPPKPKAPPESQFDE
jgi:hypothetical protein